MPWNPGIYNEFKDIRYKPFYDLVSMISSKEIKRAVDLGCGTGEQTYILSQRFPGATLVGIDSSAEMLRDSAKFEAERLQYKEGTIAAFIDEVSTWDLVFSNAALQWEDDHPSLFAAILAKLSAKGQLAVQMPYQKENVLNNLLLGLVSEVPFSDMLHGFKRPSPLLTIDEYTQLLFETGLQDIQVMLKVYPIVANDANVLLNFISGSALVPYLERLNGKQQEELRSALLERIRKHFLRFPAIYAFKRLLLYGRKP